MKTWVIVFLLAFEFLAFSQASKPVVTLATMEDLERRFPVAGEIVEVRNGGVSNLWSAPRIFEHDPLSSETADGVFVITNKANAGRYTAYDRNGPFYDVAWFGIDPSADDNATGWARVGSHANRLRWGLGRYRFSNTIKLTNALPVRWLAEAGSFQGGYISTNQVQEAELVYTGPATNTFIDMVTGKDGSGNQMIRYGHSMENISVQANGLAQTALAIGHIGRLDMTAVRYNGATDTNIYVGQLQFGRFEDCSTSINDETPTPTVRARIGMALEGFSPANTFNNCLWENSTEYAIVFGVNAKNNTIIGGAVESNDGNGIYMGNGVTANTIIGTWFENNSGGTNLVLDTGSYFNTFIGLRMSEDNLCTTYVFSSYNTFIDCQMRSVYISARGTRNKWLNCVYNGVWTDLSGGGQTYFDLIDPTATLRTNTFSSPFVMYGDYFKLWSGTNLYERSKLTYDSIEFGDGSNPTDAKIQRVSSNTLQTPNELRFMRNGITDVAFSVVTTNDAYIRLTLDSQGISVGPGDATRDTWWKRNGVNNWITEAETWFSKQATNDIALAVVRPLNAVLPFTIRGDGRLDWGDGTAARDSSIERTAPGTLTIRTNIDVPGYIACASLGLTMRPEPIVPETDTATLWLANAAASVRDLRIVWPDGLGGKDIGKLWHEFNDGIGSGLDSDLLDGQSGAYYLDRAHHTGTQSVTTISGLGPLAVTDAPTNGVAHGREDGAWVEIPAMNHVHSDYYPRSGGTNNPITGPVVLGYSTPALVLRDTSGTNVVTFTYGGPWGELVFGRADPSSLTSIGVTYAVFSDTQAIFSTDLSAPTVTGNTVSSLGYLNAGDDLRLSAADADSPGVVMLNNSGTLGVRQWFDGAHWNLYTASATPPYAEIEKLVRVETNGIVTVQKPIRTRTGTLGYLTPVAGHAPGAAAATVSTRNSKPIVAYDPTTEEHYRWTWVIPNGFNTPALDGADNLNFLLHWTSSATSGSVRWVVKLQRLTGVDIDSDSFGSGSVVTTAVSGTAGTVVVSTTGNVGLDSAVAGDAVEIDVYRDTGDAGDTVDSNDAELLAIEIRNW